MGNGSFYRKATPNRLVALAGSQSHVLYGFQENPLFGTSIDNEGSSGAAGDMALSDAAMWSGNGWYSSFGKMLQAGMRGLGLRGVGGVSTIRGVITNHAGISAAGCRKYTWIYKFTMNGTGGGGGGRLSEASASHICFASGANTIAMSLYDGGAWSSNTTGANVVYGYPMDLVIVFDGTLAGDTNRLKMYLNGRDATVNVTPGIPDTLVDPSAYTAILNGQVAGWTRAFDGELGLFAAIPNVALSLAQAQTLIEVRGHFQATAGNQADIPAGPGMFGPPDYRFLSANNDHFLSFQVTPLKTAQGTILIDFAGDDVTNQQILFGLSEEGVAALAASELTLQIRGDIVNDPLEWFRTTAGATDLRLSTPFGAGRLRVPTRYIITSDGAAIYAYREGVNQVVSAVLGANTGQWFSSVANANVSVIGRSRTAAPIGDLQGRISTIKVYDRFMPQTEAQKVCYNVHHSGGCRWYPRA